LVVDLIGIASLTVCWAWVGSISCAVF